MADLIVILEDQIRNQTFQIVLDGDVPAPQVIEGLVRQFGLPQRDFDLSPIRYYLVRPTTGRAIPVRLSLRQAGVVENELLQLVSPDGQRVWARVQDLLDEIEKEIIDEITGRIKEQIIDEVWNRVMDRLSEIENTLTGGDRVQQVRQWVDQIGGPSQFADIPEQVGEALEPYSFEAASAGGGMSIGAKAALVIITGAALVFGGLIVDNLISSPTEQPPPLVETVSPTRPVRTTEPAIETEPPREEPGDSDGDGLSDDYEDEIGTDPNNPDSDDDALNDGEEVNDTGTDPLDPDGDSDGLSDGQEVLEVGSDPFNPDSDGDGLWDGEGEFEWVREVYGDNTDPLDPDTDGDGYQDGFEMEAGSNPLDPNDPTRLQMRVTSTSDWVSVILDTDVAILDSFTVDSGGDPAVAGMEENSIDLNQDYYAAEEGNSVYLVQEIVLGGLAEYELLVFKIERGCLGYTTVEVFSLATGEPFLVARYMAQECLEREEGEYFSVEVGDLLSQSPPSDAGQGEEYFQKGVSLLEAGEHDEAIDYFNRAISLGYETGEVYYMRGWACQASYYEADACSPNGAVRDYTSAIQFDPGNIWAHINRGKIYYEELGKDSQGLEDLNQAVELESDDPNTYFHRGVYYLRHENWEALVWDMTQAIELDPGWPDLFGHRGYGYQQLGQFDQARADYEIFLELTQGNPDYAGWREEIEYWLEENPG